MQINYYKVQKVQRFHNLGDKLKGIECVGVPADLVPCIASYEYNGDRLKVLIQDNDEVLHQISVKDKFDPAKFYAVNFYKVGEYQETKK